MKKQARSSTQIDPRTLIRPLVRRLHPYVPGEQRRVKGLIKLNTNENPFPPSPRVMAAIKETVDNRLRLYPNPTAQPLREELARMHECDSDRIIVGNGSDELLALATRAFVEPAAALDPERSSRATIQYFTPSYSLYPVLAGIHGAHTNEVPLLPDFGIPPPAKLRRQKKWDFQAALSYVTTPNAPSGRGYATEELAHLCRAQNGVVVLDEAYADFADENALSLALKYPHVLVARTFSKAYSLCFQRVGYFIGHPELIHALDKIRDSYNVNGLGQAAALATLSDMGYYRENFRRVLANRKQLTLELEQLGFDVLPSQANFLLVRPPNLPARVWRDELDERKILVRWFNQARLRGWLRITVGSEDEIEGLLKAVRQVLRHTASGK